MIDMRELTPPECVALLGTVPVGRLVFTEHAMPAIRPVNFQLSGDSVVVRTTRNGSLGRLSGAVVAFEADHIDTASHTGWSVVVLGKAEEITDIDELVALSSQHNRPWAPGPRDQFLRIRFGQISGRQLQAAG